MMLFPGGLPFTLRSAVKPKFLMLLMLLPHFTTTSAFCLNQAVFCRSWCASSRLGHLFPVAWGAALWLIFYSLWTLVGGGPGQELCKFGQVSCCDAETGSPCPMSWVDQGDVSTQREQCWSITPRNRAVDPFLWPRSSGRLQFPFLYPVLSDLVPSLLKGSLSLFSWSAFPWYKGWGKSRITVVSKLNTVYSCIIR